MKLNEDEYYLITDSKLSKKGTLSDVENALKAGCKIIQYREKNKSTKDMIKEAKELKKKCEGKAIFLVNDRIDVALAVNSNGIHIGQDDIPFEIARKILGNEKIIGLTVHNLEEAVKAEKIGADYIGLSPIFDTNTKKDAGIACGVEMIKKVREIVNLPIVAIGGIDKENVNEVIKMGADSVVAISAVLCSDDVYKEVSDFIRIIKENKLK
ncbi:MAG: thiamine phosphate synthase [Candidatus Thermoplasmatota archaeon]|nr:thiamine phosphate synthase [Candidatus Thermoplasmatota archaeon]